MNAQIGKNRNNKYSLHNTSNRNGQHLTDFMIENRLTFHNTTFQKREGKLWTYTYANNNKAQIDYVFINRKWKNSAMNCEAYTSFEGVSSDHRIVTAKLRLSLRKTPHEQRQLSPTTGPYLTTEKLDRNTWYHITVCKLFALDWYSIQHTCMPKTLKKQ